MNKRKIFVIGCGLVALTVQLACSNPTAPTVAAKAAVPVGYDINIPDLVTALTLQRQYPVGIKMAPLAAQARWDYTLAYKGSPNVYFGEISPHCEYILVGILVAPAAVAAMATFTAKDWPNIWEANTTYEWVGRFVYAAVPAAGSYIINPAATSCK